MLERPAKKLQESSKKYETKAEKKLYGTETAGTQRVKFVQPQVTEDREPINRK